MSDLVEFLRARIDEDRAAALAHGSSGPSRHLRDVTPEPYGEPGRVLAECEAKRAIVDGYWPATLNDLDASDENTPVPLWTIKVLAAVYADHPDYREEWRA